MRRLAILLALLAMAHDGAVAQLTIDKYCAEVVAYSHDLLRAEAAVSGAEADMRRARKGRLPSLSMNSSVELGFANRKGERQWNWMRRADIDQPIYTGGAVRVAIKSSEEMYNVAQYEAEESYIDVAYEARAAYWSLSRAEIFHHAVAEYRRIVATLRDVVLRRFEEGYTSKSDLLQVDSRLSDAEYQLSAAEQSYMLALHNFNVLRGVEPSQGVELSSSILDSVAMPARLSIDRLLASHPEYAMSLASREAARWGVKAAAAPFIPSIGLNIYGYSQPSSPHVAGGGLKADGGVLLNFNTPIFHFRERREAVRSAESRYRISALEVESVADRLSLAESDGWTNLQTSYSRVEATRRNLALAEENLSLSTYAYGEGSATILDVLQAQISWLQIYTNAITAQYDYALAVATYRRITGDR